MTVEQMKQKKQQLGYSCEQLSELSGISLKIIQNIFSGNEKEWSLDVLQQLEKIFKENVIDSNTISASLVCESKMEYGVSKKSRECTLEDYYQLPDERRAELIDGVIYDMSAPTIIHQKISLEISVRLHAFISQKKGACMVFSAPVDVQLDCDEKTMVQPDVLVVCDREKIVPTHVYGAPDLIMEILSPATRKIDMNIKHSKYAAAGVREYWLIDPDKKKIVVYDLENEELPVVYGFENRVPVGIFQGECEIDFSEICESVKFLYQE